MMKQRQESILEDVFEAAFQGHRHSLLECLFLDIELRIENADVRSSRNRLNNLLGMLSVQKEALSIVDGVFQNNIVNLYNKKVGWIRKLVKNVEVRVRTSINHVANSFICCYYTIPLPYYGEGSP